MSSSDIFSVDVARLTLPRFSSAFPYPLPFYLVPINIYLHIRIIIAVIRAPRLKELDKYRSEAGIKGKIPILEPFNESIQFLLQSIPEFDYPMVVPPNVEPCGPILLASPPVSQVDPELATWLHKGPIVLLNLGSHTVSTAQDAVEIASGLRILLGQWPDVQVIWKL